MNQPAATSGTTAWRLDKAALPAALLAAGLLLWLYLPLLASMVKNWWVDPNYSHGFLVPVVAGGLIWRQREKLARLAAGPQPLGMVFLVGGLLVLLVGQLGHEFFLRRFSLLPVLWGLIMLTWGWPVARQVAFAFCYMVLMIPWPYVLYDSLAFPLRLLAASLAGWGIRLFGTPVLVEGNVLHLPTFSMDVVDACSGIRSLVSLLAVGALLAYLYLPRRWLKVLLVLLVPLVAVLTNSTRVMVTGLLGMRFGEAVTEGAGHDFVGWLVFMAGFLLLAGLTWLLGRIYPKGAGHER